MGKINVYLPADLEAKVKEAEGLNISAVCQEALREAVNNPLKSEECKHNVVVRRTNGVHRCELCGETIDIRYNTKKRRAS